MKIERSMNVGALAELMGAAANMADAEEMRAILIDSNYGLTESIPPADWLEMCIRAVKRADYSVVDVQRERDL